MQSLMHPAFVQSRTVFLPLLGATKGVLMAYGVLLTYQVRTIPSRFNESLYIAVALYNIGTLAVIVLVRP
jgi:hypothetical protein